MKWKLVAAGIGLAVLLAGIATSEMKASAQSSPTEVGRRRVRLKVEPQYPDLARQLNFRGKVRLEATVAADGHVVSTKVLGGNPILANASVAALEKWRFEPAEKDSVEEVEFDFGER